jgi:hypothetical protein
MTVAYCRSDIQSIAVSPDQGGCGQVHSKGGAAVFKLDCDQCAAVVLGHTRPKVWKWKEGIGHQQGQLDNWDGWASTITDIPLTPTELLERDRTKRTGQTELERLQAMTMAHQLGIPVPEALAASLGGVRALEEMRADPQVICSAGHANRPGARFCDLCGTSMQAPGAEEASAA